MTNREEYIGEVYTGELVAPAVVIGVGQAGLNVVQTLYDMVSSGEKKYFRFIAIDSNRDDLNKSIKSDDILKITLDKPIGDFKPIISECNYLYEDLELRGTGVTRQRALGRFLLDYEDNYKKVYNNLSSTISNLAEIHRDDLYASGQVIMSIYIIHYLGGGTGSGTFTLLSAMVHNISRNVLESKRKGYFIAGIGFLPSATNLTLSVLDIDKYYFANSYAALMELKKLGEINSKNPLIIPLFNRKVDEEIKIATKPFNKYFIVGLNEEELNEVKKKRQSERYMQQRNEVVANAIYSLHKWPKGADNRWLHPITSFATFGQAELHIPIEQVKEYVKLREEIIELNGKLSKDIEELNFEYRNEIEELNKRLGKEISETKYSLDSTFNGEIRIRSIEELNEEKLSNLCQTIKQNYGLISVEYIAEKITKNLEERRNDAIKELEKYINDLWIEYEMEQEYPDTISFEEK
ncbi:MAG: tubulin-like doman-containing protein, partial [Methanosarcinales archaeon]